jgi:glucose-1-phosphate cytidylyltransferase
VKVAILCGGQGTRLREETEYRPKPMVPVGGRPILWHVMKHYAHFGFKDFALCLGYRGDIIKEYFLRYRAMNCDVTLRLGHEDEIQYHDAHEEEDYAVTLADTGEYTMTGGRLQRIQKHIGKETFMVTYGDGLSNVDVSAVLDFHRSHGRIATVTTMRPSSRFGLLDVDEGGEVNSFREKPALEGWANAGFMVFEPKIFDYLDGDSCILEREPLERLVAAGQLMAYRHDGFFFAMDTYREYVELNEMWDNGDAPWKIW